MSAPDLAALADQLFAVECAADPIGASLFGAPGHDDGVADLSREGEAHVALRLTEIAERAEAVDPGTLDDADRVTRAVLVQRARANAALCADGHTDLTITGPASPLASVFTGMDKVTLGNPRAEKDYLARTQGLAGMVRAWAERLETAADRGRTNVQVCVDRAVGRLSAYLGAGLADDPLLAPARNSPVEEQVRAVLETEVRPAFAALLATLDGPVRAEARSNDRPGLVHLRDGGEVYARALAGHTTLERDPGELHRLGLSLLESLRDEIADLGVAVFGTSELSAVTERLRSDPSLRYRTPEQMLADARGAVARAEEVLPSWFGRGFGSPCEVAAMNPLEAADASPAYYVPPAAGRAGSYRVNTLAPETRTRYEYEAIAFHEGVPGHHLQFALGQELGEDVPAFRRLFYVTAFSEGWGLYAERLADEMGLYSSDLARFGMLSLDAWRAGRLVVDTGLHHRGWTRQQAVDFLWANTALTRESIVTEVDRSIAWPGQACAYMTGRLALDELRREARLRLGDAFDIRGFHDEVHRNGSVPLGVLRDEVLRWSSQPVS